MRKSRDAPPGAPTQAQFRKAVLERDDAVCSQCGAHDPDHWQADHVVELWSVRHLPDANRLWYFTADNGQTLCWPCHKIKSAKNRARHAHHDRLAGVKKPRATDVPF